MKQRATRRGRPHCEAFPALDIVQGERSLRAAGGGVTWLDECGHVVGTGRLLELSGTRAVFSYEFAGSTNIKRVNAIVKLEISGTKRSPDVVRKSFACPGCAARAEKLYFVEGVWKCRTCHGLVYLKQRLGKANKKIAERDAGRLMLDGLSATMQATREYRNMVRHLERLDRELAAQELTNLPQELLFRTEQVWQPFIALRTNIAVGAGVRAEARDVAANSFTAGLAFYRPPSPPLPPLVPCEPVGSIVLDRPWEAFLSRHKQEQAAQLIADHPQRLAGIEGLRLAALLAEQIEIRPIVITSDWSEMETSVSPDGRTEHSITASYMGDPTLWRVSPSPKPYKRILRVILNDTEITIRVRSLEPGRTDPQPSLNATAIELGRRLEGVEERAGQFNAQRLDHAWRWLIHNWREPLTHGRTLPDRRFRRRPDAA